MSIVAETNADRGDHVLRVCQCLLVAPAFVIEKLPHDVLLDAHGFPISRANREALAIGVVEGVGRFLFRRRRLCLACFVEDLVELALEVRLLGLRRLGLGRRRRSFFRDRDFLGLRRRRRNFLRLGFFQFGRRSLEIGLLGDRDEIDVKYRNRLRLAHHRRNDGDPAPGKGEVDNQRDGTAKSHTGRSLSLLRTFLRVRIDGQANLGEPAIPAAGSGLP